MRTGFIADKNLLPITRLNFGRITKSGLQSSFTLGPFECSGSHHSLNSNIIPTNCTDLFFLGHIRNGFYLVGKGDLSGSTSTIYCDFSRLSFDVESVEQQWPSPSNCTQNSTTRVEDLEKQVNAPGLLKI